jgi:DNA-binding GntR family transcriptional regulator
MAVPGSTSRVELAYATIRQRIMSGIYGPGYRLVLDELAREIGSSPVPVREAIRRLEAEGYVDFRRHVGARVASFDEHELAQAVQVVAVLEGYATALAAPRLRRADIAKARKINDRMSAALADLDAARFAGLDRDFHAVCYSRCPNAQVLALLESQWARLDAARRSTAAVAAGRARAAVAEHGELLDLVGGGAPADLIEQLARTHQLSTGITGRGSR